VGQGFSPAGPKDADVNYLTIARGSRDAVVNNAKIAEKVAGESLCVSL
jgi:hypothetical protein